MTRRNKVAGSISLLTLTALTLILLLIGFMENYYQQRVMFLENQQVYYHNENKKLRQRLDSPATTNSKAHVSTTISASKAAEIE